MCQHWWPQTLVHQSNRRQWWMIELVLWGTVIHFLALFMVFEHEAVVEKHCLWPIYGTFHLWDICSYQSGDISIDIEINCNDIKIDILGQYQTLGSIRFRFFFFYKIDLSCLDLKYEDKMHFEDPSSPPFQNWHPQTPLSPTNTLLWHHFYQSSSSSSWFTTIIFMIHMTRFQLKLPVVNHNVTKNLTCHRMRVAVAKIYQINPQNYSTQNMCEML